MAKKLPQRVSADLFSSPGSSTGLSVGLDEAFSSPFSLVATNSGQRVGGSLNVTPSHSLSSSQRSSPAPGNDPMLQVNASPFKPSTSDELSTVPLDSPILGSEQQVPITSAPVRSKTDSDVIGQNKSGAARPYEYGWNDPPSVYSTQVTPNRPHVSRTITSPVTSASTDIPIQPLASQSGSQNGSNPYRIGTGIGSRKPAYEASGIASFSSTSSSVGSQQPMIPPHYQPTVADAFQGAQNMPLPPTSSSVPPSSSSSFSNSSSQPYNPASNIWAEQQGRPMPIMHHWFYLRSQESYWIPFSLMDSGYLESAVLNCQDPSQQVLVPTDGGRYDVDLYTRQRKAVYWEEPVSEVRRCSWFYKREMDRWYLPYDEITAQLLEEKYQDALSRSSWNYKVELADGDYVIMHSFSSIVHYSHHSTGSLDTGALDLEGTSAHPRAVMRGFAELDKVETGEQSRVDHLVFFVHGIGAHYDLSFRRLVDCVDDFREVSQLMLKTHHFSNQAPREGDGGGRVEFLPVHWHSKLHTTGVDERLKPLTLPSITRLRDFTNSTLLDILYFTSPLFCQTIVSEVASEMNRMYEIFKQRNPSFVGGVSVVGHSLGSVILFDLLCHQHKDSQPHQDPQPHQHQDPQPGTVDITSNNGSTSAQRLEGEQEVGGAVEDEPDGSKTLQEVLAQLNLENVLEKFHNEQIDFDSLLMCTNEDLKELGLAMGPRKKLSSFIAQETERQKLVNEHKVKEASEQAEREQRESKDFTDSANFFGVKIIKGVAGTGQTYVTYPQLAFTPQHLFALGSPIGLFLTVRGVEDLGPDFSLPTCDSVFNIFHPFDPVAYRIEPLILNSSPKQAVLMPHHKGRKRFHLELYENLGYVGASIKHHLVEGMRNMWQQLNTLARSHTSQPSSEPDTEIEPSVTDVVDVASSEDLLPIGMLNKGRRIDHVLQEKPIEKLNEYLFALSSHLCYWHSEDTALFLLKEVYQEPNPELIKY